MTTAADFAKRLDQTAEETERVLEAIAGTMAAASAELKEGVAAFRDKRKPRF